MTHPTCAQCDCMAGCQANPKACPNLMAKPADDIGNFTDLYAAYMTGFHAGKRSIQAEQPAPVCQPLTYAKLIDMLVDVWDSDDETLIRFARAIEEAHGITKAEK